MCRSVPWLGRLGPQQGQEQCHWGYGCCWEVAWCSTGTPQTQVCHTHCREYVFAGHRGAGKGWEAGRRLGQWRFLRWLVKLTFHRLTETCTVHTCVYKSRDNGCVAQLGVLLLQDMNDCSWSWNNRSFVVLGSADWLLLKTHLCGGLFSTCSIIFPCISLCVLHSCVSMSLRISLLV